jgi:hypothetical protein
MAQSCKWTRTSLGTSRTGQLHVILRLSSSRTSSSNSSVCCFDLPEADHSFKHGLEDHPLVIVPREERIYANVTGYPC